VVGLGSGTRDSIRRPKMDSLILLDDFACRLKLHLVLIRIAEQPLGSALPKDIGKLTKVQLTTGLVPKTGNHGKQAEANTVKIGGRLARKVNNAWYAAITAQVLKI
jgi:hypothetical protein